MQKLALLGAAASCAIASPVSASTTIDFTGLTGTYGSGLSTGGVDFTTDLGTGLEVGNFGVQTDGEGLVARTDTDGNFIIGTMSFTADSMSLDFGNDDPFFSDAGDLAVLKLYLGATLVDTILMALTPDDIMNQTIFFSGSSFDSFSFAYTDAVGSPFTGGGDKLVGMNEVIDNIVFQNVTTAVPEPATWAMMLMGFGAIGFGLRRRKQMELTFARAA
jgi:hypothetical protein